jgi:hypothetical protein
MTDALSFAEIDAQHLELLPARTVLSLFATTGGGGKGGDVTGGAGGHGGEGEGKASIAHNWFYIEDGYVYNTATGGQGGAADGGAATGGAASGK